jgi:acetoacetyl-CoA synthetase
VPIKRILLGRPVDEVLNPAAVDAPELLAAFANIALTRQPS